MTVWSHHYLGVMGLSRESKKVGRDKDRALGKVQYLRKES